MVSGVAETIRGVYEARGWLGNPFVERFSGRVLRDAQGESGSGVVATPGRTGADRLSRRGS